jgi:hypothetical protein
MRKENCIDDIGEKARSLRRPRYRWTDNNKLDLGEIE